MTSAFTEIQNAISSKNYEKAIDTTIVLLDNALSSENKDHLALSLQVINAICDKSDNTLEKTLNSIRDLLDHPDYWVRQESLHILKKIYIIRPDKFDPLIEKIESKLFDNDKKVREAAVGLISLILSQSLNHYPELYLSYSRMFEDHSWTVRAKALQGVLQFITIDSKPSSELVNAFELNIFQLFRDPDEEVRGLAAEVLRILCFHTDPEKIISILLPLLKDVDWEIREKTIWIIGEIGSIYYDQFQSLFKNLVLMFTDEIMMIQTKVIDAFVKIGKQHGIQLLDLFIPYISELDDDINQGISETIIYITLQNKKELLPILISRLDDQRSSIQNMMGNCLLKIYMESPNGIEEQLFYLFQSLNPEDWRQRKRIIKILGDLCYVLRIQSVSVWTTINLLNWQKNEKDLDVLDEIDSSLAKIHNVFEKLDNEIAEVERRKKKLYDDMNFLENLPQKLRMDAEMLIKKKKFNEAEILLEEEGNKISENLADFEKKLNESEFKRFSIDVLQDFSDVKDEILENVSDVKSVMYNVICDGRSEYIQELDGEIEKIQSRIEVLKVEFESAKKMQDQLKDLVNHNDTQKTEMFLETISSIREKLYKLEFDIGQTWLNNLEFKDFLKQITILWIDVKIEIQQFLAEIFHKFRQISNALEKDPDNSSTLKKKITFEFLNQQFQNTLLQAIQNQREVLEQFSSIVMPIEKEFKKRKFKETRHLISLTINNLYSQIENYNREINKIYQDIDAIDVPISSANEIRKSLHNWNEVKDLLLERIHNYKNEIENKILVEEIKEFLKYMNPIPLNHLSRLLSMNLNELKEKLFLLIQSHVLSGEIRNDELIQPELPLEENFLTFYRKIEIIGTKLHFSLRVYNPTKFFINDLSFLFLAPEALSQIIEESDPTEIYIREFEPEAIRVVRWNFRINKTSEKRYDLQKFTLNVSYKNPFNELTTFQKDMDMIL